MIAEAERLDRLRRARRPGARAPARRADAHRRDAARSSEATIELPTARRTLGRAGRDPADGRRAVEHARSSSTTARAQALPAARAGREPRARAAALPHRARASSTSPPLEGWCGVRGPAARGDARDPAAVRARARRRLGARARHARVRPGLAAGARAPARRGDRRAARRARRRPGRPALRARRSRAPSRSRCSRASVDEEIESVFSTCPTTEALAPIARPRRGGARPAARAARTSGSVGKRDPPPRRLPPRPGALDDGDDWVVLDFEGEPARRCPSGGASARRCATSPGCCARSPTPRRASQLQRGVERAGRAGRSAAAERSSTATSATVEPRAPAAGEQAIERLLAVFELEKAVYELRYELDNRPDWVGDPGRRDPAAAGGAGVRPSMRLGELDLHLAGRGPPRADLRAARRARRRGRRLASPSGRRTRARVAVVGDWNGWDGHADPLRRSARPGIWERFVAEAAEGERYKFEVRRRRRRHAPEGRPVRVPGRGAAAGPPRSSTAPRYEWGDDDWLERRRDRRPAREPLSIYEVHLGSWRLGLRLAGARRAARRLRGRARLHARRAAAGDAAPVLRLVGLPGDGLLRARLALRRRRTTSARSSTRCTSAGSA